MRRALPVVFLLAGCSAPAPAVGPLSAELSETELSLVLTDGTTCRADWRQSPNGRFDACGPGFGYAVTEVANPNLLRKFWVEAATALGAAGAVPPMAEVVITDASGRDHLFVSPVPFN